MKLLYILLKILLIRKFSLVYYFYMEDVYKQKVFFNREYKKL
jgi:hypothetical protein